MSAFSAQLQRKLARREAQNKSAGTMLFQNPRDFQPSREGFSVSQLRAVTTQSVLTSGLAYLCSCTCPAPCSPPRIRAYRRSWPLAARLRRDTPMPNRGLNLRRVFRARARERERERERKRERERQRQRNKERVRGKKRNNERSKEGREVVLDR